MSVRCEAWEIICKAKLELITSSQPLIFKELKNYVADICELISFSNFKLFSLNSCRVEGGNNSSGQSGKFWLPEGFCWILPILRGQVQSPDSWDTKHNHSITPRSFWCLFWLKQLWKTEIWGNLVRRIWQPLLAAKIDVLQGKTRRKYGLVGKKKPSCFSKQRTESILPTLNDAESFASQWGSQWFKPKVTIWAGLFNSLKCPGRYQHSPECPWINKCWQAYFTESSEVPQSSPVVVDGFNLKQIINL